MKSKHNARPPKTSEGDPREVISAVEYSALDEEARTSYRPVERRYERLPLFAWILYGVAGLCLILYILQVNSIGFSDWFNATIGAAFRRVLAAVTSPLPFSLGECCLFLLPVALVFIIRHAIRCRCDTWRTAGVYVATLLSIVVSIFSIFTLDFAAGYRGSTLDRKLELAQEKVSAEELYDTAMTLIEAINAETTNVSFGDDGFSVMPYPLDGLNDELMAAYESFCGDHDFIGSSYSRVKPVMASEVMSYMHITGVYSFFTGEANINVNFPAYTIPYTAAHELAHQRGIARENEANFIAFLVCIRSEDSYVRYSGYLNLYEYVANALYSADRELYYRASAHLNEEVRQEMSAYNRFYDKYKTSTVSKVSDTVNNTYLQIQGTTAGTKSYGMVVDLAVAYYKTRTGG